MGKRNRRKNEFERGAETGSKRKREWDEQRNNGKRALVIDLTEESNEAADEYSGPSSSHKGRESPWSIGVSSSSDEEQTPEDYPIHRKKHQHASKTRVTELDDVVIVEAKELGGESTTSVDGDNSTFKFTEKASKKKMLKATARGDPGSKRKRHESIERKRGKIKEKGDWVDEETERKSDSSSETESSLSGLENAEDCEEECMMMEESRRRKESKKKRKSRNKNLDEKIRHDQKRQKRKNVEDNTMRSSNDDLERSNEDVSERSLEDGSERNNEDYSERNSEDDLERSYDDGTERTSEDNMERSYEEVDEVEELDLPEDREREDHPKIAAHRFEEDVLLIIQEREVCLKGFCRIKCLFGGVRILGYNLNQHSEKFVDFYSPESNSLLTLSCDFPADNAEARNKLSNIYSKYRLDSHYEDGPHCGDVVIVLLRKLTSYSCDYISTIPPYTKLFSPYSGERNKHSYSELSAVGVHYVPKYSKVRRLKISEDYTFIEEKWHSALNSGVCPAVVVCGSKNTGKSTMNRFLLNSTLNRKEGLYYLECDVGQTEFSPPGCISLNYLQNPVLGPPFCHQQLSENTYYFGAVTPAGNPDYYIQCVQKCVEAYRATGSKLPLIVNTMGWNKGLGLDLLVDTLRMVRPTLVIQLNCQKRHLNFPLLTSYNIMKEEGWIQKSKSSGIDWSPSSVEHQHDLIIIEAPVNPQQLDVSPLGLRPVDHRNLTILSYFSRDFHSGRTLTSAIPYMVNWSEVAIYVHNQSVPQSQILYAVNMSVVALCVADLKKAHRAADDQPWQFTSLPVCHCLGFGLVRGIDPATSKIYIVTPLLPYQLSNVNTIVRGDLNIPDQLLLFQKMEKISYVSMTTTTIGSSSLQQRRHMPRRDKINRRGAPERGDT